MKKILMLLLSVILCLSLCACSKAADYEAAVALMEAEDYLEAMKAFEKVGDYEDSAQLLEECKDILYGEALDMLYYGECDEAAALFAALGNYEDSAQMVEECGLTKLYLEAEALFYEEQFEQARALFVELGDFENSADRVLECEIEMIYSEAVALMEAGSYTKAQELFESIADQKYVDDYLEACEGIEDLIRNPMYPKLCDLMGMDVAEMVLENAYSDDEHVAAFPANYTEIVPEYIFEMGDGSMLQLPMTYGDLLDAGWNLEYGMEEEEFSSIFPGEEYIWCSFINAEGKTMNAELGNYSDSPIDLWDAVVTQLQVGGDETENFSVSGITLGATVEDIMAVFGRPLQISYYEWESGGKDFSFYYIDDINYSSISFDMDPETGLLNSVCYSVTDPPAEWFE